MGKIKFNKTIATLTICLLVLTIFGCVMVYSASMYSAGKNMHNEFYFLVKQIIGVVLGFLAFLFFCFFDYTKLKRFKWIAVIVSVILLLLVFVPFLGIENYGAKRWIGIAGFSFQPSEIAKFALVIFASAHFSQNSKKAKTFKNMLPVLAVGGLFCLLVIIEPNMSITMCIGLVMMFMLFIGGAKFKHFMWLALPALCLVPALVIMEPYRLKRIMAFINPWASPQGEGFQLIQSLYSLGSGGLFGVGLFSSRQKYLYLPFAESDFIFSIIGEELGFMGSFMIILVFFVLIATLIKISLNAKDRFGSLLVAGIASIIAIQVIINIAVVTGSIPPTGLPLPFISAGSTSLMVFMGAMGICVNVYKSRNKHGLETKKQSFNFNIFKKSK